MLQMPFVNSKDGQNDLFSRLLQDRIVMLCDAVSDESAQLVISQLLYLDSLSHDPITLYINSPGGYCTSGLGIVDTIEHIESPVKGIVIGMAASMGAVILSVCDERYATRNSEIMIHQPLGGCGGQATDIQIQAENILKTKKRLTQILADNTFLTFEEMYAVCERDYYMDVEEAMDIGILDGVIKPSKKKGKK